MVSWSRMGHPVWKILNNHHHPSWSACTKTMIATRTHNAIVSPHLSVAASPIRDLIPSCYFIKSQRNRQQKNGHHHNESLLGQAICVCVDEYFILAYFLLSLSAPNHVLFNKKFSRWLQWLVEDHKFQPSVSACDQECPCNRSCNMRCINTFMWIIHFSRFLHAGDNEQRQATDQMSFCMGIYLLLWQ